MEIKLVAVDLDGTLLKDDKTLSKGTIAAVARAAAHGVEVVLATGRTLREFSQLLRLLPDVHYAVACTGASVMDCRTGRELHQEPLSAETLREAWRRLREFDVLFEVFQDGKILVDEEKMPHLDDYMAASRNPGLPGTRGGKAEFDRWLETQDKPAAKVHMFFRDTETRDAAWDAIRDLDALVCCSDAVDLEIMARGVDKGTGLGWLASYLQIRREEVMAIGDSGNDLGMLEYAGVRAVMGNASPELRAMADLVADTNERDGVAKLLDELLAGRLSMPETGPLQ